MSDILLLGAGNLGTALLKGWITSPDFTQNITVITKSGVARDESLQNDPRLTFTHIPPSTLSDETIVIIAVKPCMIKEVFAPLTKLHPKNVVSVAAGISLKSIQSLAPSAQITRAMPTISAATHQSCTVLLNSNDDITALFDRLGSTIHMSDDQAIDVATMLSASGTGLIYHFYQSMMEVAIKNGLTDKNAETLIQSVIQGCAQETRDKADFKTLITQIATPSGTTEAMIEAADNDIQKALVSAFDEGIKRAQGLDKAFASQS